MAGSICYRLAIAVNGHSALSTTAVTISAVPTSSSGYNGPMNSKTVWALLVAMFLALFISACGSSTPTVSTSQQSALKLSKVGQFDNPITLTTAPGSSDRYIVEQQGQIIRQTAAGTSIWLDITGIVQSGGEQGLLSLAFAPDWQQSGLFYVYYTDKSGDQVVAEGQGTATSGQLSRTVLTIDDFAANHNGGQLLFGPGGLYIATGDGGGSGDPQRSALNLKSLLGKILRIIPEASGDRPYTIPDDNPFVGDKNKRPEIFSFGLRNPWRFSINAGRIWIADVGQGKQEEVSAPLLSRARGGNFGWSAWEGRQRFNTDQQAENPIEPVFIYGRDRGCSITGGYLVQHPGELQNRYIYSDFCQGQIRSFQLVNGRAVDDRSTGLQVPQPVSFAADADGRVMVISLDGGIYLID